ncbi:aminotransferase class IV [Chryseobacterium sp. A301]
MGLSTSTPSRAFLYGDAVSVSFFVRNSKLVFAEESYFFLMASMRKMRMRIPLSYTLEFFQELFQNELLKEDSKEGIIHFMVYRETGDGPLEKADVKYWFGFSPLPELISLQQPLKMDLIKEINVNTNLLSNIRVHCSENIYGQIYALENDLDDVILLNPNKRIARSTLGNLLLLNDEVIRVPKQTEGAYISPLMEAFVTFIHKNNLAQIEQAELVAFESQKAEEILMISEEKGIFSVGKIRNKEFSNLRFKEWIQKWKESMLD